MFAGLEDLVVGLEFEFDVSELAWDHGLFVPDRIGVGWVCPTSCDDVIGDPFAVGPGQRDEPDREACCWAIAGDSKFDAREAREVQRGGEFWGGVEESVVAPFGLDQLRDAEGEIIDDIVEPLRVGWRVAAGGIFIGHEGWVQLTDAFALPLGFERDDFGIGVREIAVGFGFAVSFAFADDPSVGQVHDFIVLAVEEMGEPLVEELDWGLSAVATLMVVDFAWQTFLLGGLVDAVAMFGHDVPVVEGMGHKECCLHLVELMDVVATFPEFVVVAVGSVEVFEHAIVADIAIAEVSRGVVS